MVRRHHPVLAVISNCYSEPKGRFPRVTHPCATRPEGLVRLACVRHAASVRSEPESNSQVDVRLDPGGIPEARPASLGAVPAQIYKLVCLRMRTFARSIAASRNGSRIKERLEFDRSFRRPEVVRDRAAAHMSLHLNRQCQRADAPLPPVHLVPGVVCRLVETRTRWRSEPAAAAAVRGHIWRRLRSVNRLFQNFRNQSVTRLKFPGNPSVATRSCGLDVSSHRLGFGLAAVIFTLAVGPASAATAKSSAAAAKSPR